MGRNPCPSELVALKERRTRLQDRIDQFSARALTAWPVNSEEDLPSFFADLTEADNLLSDDSEDDDEQDFNRQFPLQADWAPELATLVLPSTLGQDACDFLGYGSLVVKERKLRMGQANDALQGIRVALSRKAIFFRGLREATSKTKRNRSWDHIKSTTGSARHYVRIYLRARKALLRLGTPADELAKYQPLTRDQLKITAARIDPALRGVRNSNLAWFWTLDVQGDTEAAEGMEECKFNQHFFVKQLCSYATIFTVYRVHWLKAKARNDRWTEEVVLILSEMDWTQQFFHFMGHKWDKLAAEQVGPEETYDETRTVHRRSLAAYAAKQAAMWKRMEARANAAFSDARLKSGMQ